MPSARPVEAAVGLRPGRLRLLVILWPAFVLAGVLEALVFFVIDPGSLHGWSVQPIEWSRTAVYSVTFFMFWGVIATSAAISQWLDSPELG